MTLTAAESSEAPNAGPDPLPSTATGRPRYFARLRSSYGSLVGIGVLALVLLV